MLLIADECLNQNLINLLIREGYDVNAINKTNSGISDFEVINLVKNLEGILITEDADFGEWVFAHHIKNLSVVFLRYDKIYLNFIQERLLEEIKNIVLEVDKYFITISNKKVRRRRID